VIVRTALTDAIRAVGVRGGAAPFAQPGASLARWLVASPVMRTAYATAKLVAFCGLALVNALGPAAVPGMLPALRGIAWVAVGLCLLRGAPVLAGVRGGIGALGPTASGSTAARSR
jgi:hypothetical protein